MQMFRDKRCDKCEGLIGFDNKENIFRCKDCNKEYNYSIEREFDDYNSAVRDDLIVLRTMMATLIHESQKTNKLLSKMIKEPKSDNIKQLDKEKAPNDNIVLVTESLNPIIDLACDWCDSKNTDFFVVETALIDDLFLALSHANENDYVIVNLDVMTREQLEILLETRHKHNIYCDVGSGLNIFSAQAEIKPFKYIFCTDMLETVDKTLIEGLEIFQYS